MATIIEILYVSCSNMNCQPTKHKRGFARAFLFAILSSVCAPRLPAQTLVWNNGAATGNWNTTDANWTGSVSIKVAADPQRFYRVMPTP